MLKRTPLYAAHQKLGGKLIEFGGWEMPVQYTSILDEHQAVRAAAGLFDISHMGEARVSGPKAQDFLNHVLTNDLRKAPAGRGQYTLMCNERGGVVDDLYAYHLGTNDFLLVINAATFGLSAWLVPGFAVHGFEAALLGSLLYSIAGWITSHFIHGGRPQLRGRHRVDVIEGQVVQR